MTPLTKSRLKGLAEKLGLTVTPGADGKLYLWKDYKGSLISTFDLDWLQETLDGAGFILKWMLAQTKQKQCASFDSFIHKGWVESEDEYIWQFMTPARIAQAAADAMEVLE